jgi:hypothetical protein
MADLTNALERNNFERIAGLRERFRGEQCVVLCTGPSANEVDLSLVEQHPFVMGVNGSYLLRNNFHSYFASNTCFVKSNTARIAQIQTERIFVRRKTAAQCLAAGIEERRLLLFDGAEEGITTEIETDLTRPLPWGPPVLLTIVLPALVWCGFQEILLIGADFPVHGYSRFHTGREDAPRGREKSLELYEIEMEIGRFRAALWAQFLRRQRPPVRVLNCSPRSELEAFERADLRQAVRG